MGRPREAATAAGRVPERWVVAAVREMHAEHCCPDGPDWPRPGCDGPDPNEWRAAVCALQPVLGDLKRQVETIRNSYDRRSDEYWAFEGVLDLLDTGGSDG